MKRIGVGLLVLALLAPLTVGAFNAQNRICWDGSDATAVSYRLYFRTSATGPETAVSVLRSAATADSVKCVAPQIGVTLGTLGLPDNATYFLKATAINADGNESVRSVEVIPSPFSYSTVAPPAVTGLSVR